MKPAPLAEMQAFQLSRRGYLLAVLASRRGALSGRLEIAHRKLGREDVPVWAFWGREDTTIPLSAMGTLVMWNRAVHNDDIAGAGHGLPYTHADELAAADELAEAKAEAEAAGAVGAAAGAAWALCCGGASNEPVACRTDAAAAWGGGGGGAPWVKKSCSKPADCAGAAAGGEVGWGVSSKGLNAN